jgi:hypothetical protein
LQDYVESSDSESEGELVQDGHMHVRSSPLQDVQNFGIHEKLDGAKEVEYEEVQQVYKNLQRAQVQGQQRMYRSAEVSVSSLGVEGSLLGARAGSAEDADLISTAATENLEDYIVDMQPTNEYAMMLQSSNMRENCERMLGEAFQAAYSYCKTQYGKEDVDMAQVQQDLLALANVGLAEPQKRAAINLLEMLVFNELYRH